MGRGFAPPACKTAMEPVFVIHNRKIPQMLTEVYSYQTRWLRYGICGVFALITLGTGLAGILPRVWKDIVLYAAFVIPAAWFTPHLIVWLAMRTVRKENNGCIPEVIVTVEEDGIWVREDLQEIVVPYSRITKAKRLKHSWFIAAASPASVVLDVTGFSKGTPEAFPVFLRQKRPDLKIKA